MQLGSHILRNGLIVAPMAGVTDRAFRKLCRRFGAGLAVSEMIGSSDRLRDSEKTLKRTDHEGEPGPVSVQIAGADPAMMADAARYNAGRGAQIIDINMGCPAKKVCNRAAGSALLRDENLVGRILDAVVGAVSVPVTLKIRTGWDRESRNAVRVARMAEAAGVRMIAVHGRTRACGFGGSAEYDTIAEVKSQVRIPVIANGDITTAEQAGEVLRRTGADGVMIGRGAQGRPWLFGQIEHFLATGRRLAPPPAESILAIAAAHLDELYSLYGSVAGVRIARKHIAWYTKDRPGAEDFRRSFNLLETCSQQQEAVAAFFASPGIEACRALHEGERVFA